MRGVIFLGGRKLQVAHFPDPTPGPHDVVVEIKASGMCGSDLKFYRATGGETAALGLGKLEGPVIAGHEPCGVVAAVGNKVEERAAASALASWCITIAVAAPASIVAAGGRRCARPEARSMASPRMARMPIT